LVVWLKIHLLRNGWPNGRFWTRGRHISRQAEAGGKNNLEKDFK
jgi:hypothetical protein